MSTHELVRIYYGKELRSSADLKTTACCDADAVPPSLRPLLANVHPEVKSRYYGCGLVAPSLLEGCTVVDLGCGAGRDVYLLAQLVGPRGRVVGIDMTPEQLAIARQYQTYHAEIFGFANVSFYEGEIEALEALDFAVGSVDVVVSNCVLNLSDDKGAVLRGVKHLLKPGGELYFSDVYVDRRLPESARRDPVLYAECLGGALYWNDFLHLSQECGFFDPRLVSDRSLHITSPELLALVNEARFFSATYRLFQLDGLEISCEDYGQMVTYLGTVPEHPDHFPLDAHHLFATGQPTKVCRNTYLMLSQSRFANHFMCLGDGNVHEGLFAGCGQTMPFSSSEVLSSCEGSQEPVSSGSTKGCC